MKNPYRFVGIILCVASAVLAPVFYFVIRSVPLTGVALSAIIIGFTCIGLANARPYLPPEACEMLLQTGMENTASLLEELNLKNKAVYLPSEMRGGRSQALIPLADDSVMLIKEKMPGRLIVRYGVQPGNMAIAVTTPGSVNLKLLATKPLATAGGIESAITYVLTGVLDMASSVAVDIVDSRISVAVNNPRMHYEDIWYYNSLGSPIASISAAIASEALGKPVRIKEESYNKEKKKSDIVLEVLS